MICAVNIGNTHIVIGLKKNNCLVKIERYKTTFFCNYRGERVLSRFFKDINSLDIEYIISTSVAPNLNNIVCEELFYFTKSVPIILDNEYFKSIKFNFESYAEKQIGTDRLVVSYYASKMYELPAVIIDFGTAITLNIIGYSGEFLGGAIIPGIFIWMDSLCKNTILLPDTIQLVKPISYIGHSTSECISVGILHGISSLVDGLVIKFESQVGYFKSIIATGGGAEIILPYCKRNILYKKELLLEGIFYIYETELNN